MSGDIALALDAMGGDQAPDMVVRGANLARKRFPSARFIFFGDEVQIAPLLKRMPRLAKISSIVHTDQVISGEDKPSIALRTGRQSSMRLAINAVHDGQAAGVVSAGNTGALMAMAKFVLKTLPGISRPAIASFFPTMRGESVMLDLGANLQCDAENLMQFAIMGEVFARTVLGTVRPSIGLLNVGSEDLKGHEALREASAMLRELDLPGTFHGFVEGDDIAKGTVDVVVTDGFTGNIALKSIEGTARLYSEFLRATFKSSLLAKIGYLLARPALGALRLRTDPRRYNGAIFLGLNGVTVKSHGGTDAIGFSNAIGVAVDMILHGAIEKIREDFAHLSPAAATTGAQVATLG
ncbi:MAG: phosphate acyltransferase PlsX [Dongiaceae bacterium]